MLPEPLLIPPPPPPEAQPGPGGCFRSNLRSPVLLMDRLLRDLLQCSPYTPPPMLSPIRQGSGLYFNAVCSSTAAEPRWLLRGVLGKDGRWGCSRAAPKRHRSACGSGWLPLCSVLCLWGLRGENWPCCPQLWALRRASRCESQLLIPVVGCGICGVLRSER